MVMKIVISYNRSGRKLAESLIDYMVLLDHDVIDMGRDCQDCDCADGVYNAGVAMLKRGYDRLVLVYGAGMASSMAANKIKGLYAAPCYDVFEARLARQLYNTNVLCLADRWLDADTAQKILKEWLDTAFHHNVRRNRALRKIRAIEQGLNPAAVTEPQSLAPAT
ncbi:MAG: RpiB/LacA/LacB family sugar-phosphate isomerase [Planctomycetaceae bacterium]|nr:RpiB/LacA/LacB family sugar-phosphate isomerase [Planctomycetaceae bacterium]